MTVNVRSLEEVISALGKCANECGGESCPYWDEDDDGCEDNLMMDALWHLKELIKEVENEKI